MPKETMDMPPEKPKNQGTTAAVTPQIDPVSYEPANPLAKYLRYPERYGREIRKIFLTMIKKKVSEEDITDFQTLVKGAVEEFGPETISQGFSAYIFGGGTWGRFRLMEIFSTPELYNCLQEDELQSIYKTYGDNPSFTFISNTQSKTVREYGDKPSFSSISESEWKIAAEAATKNYAAVMKKMNEAKQAAAKKIPPKIVTTNAAILEVLENARKSFDNTSTSSGSANDNAPTPFGFKVGETNPYAKALNEKYLSDTQNKTKKDEKALSEKEKTYERTSSLSLIIKVNIEQINKHSLTPDTKKKILEIISNAAFDWSPYFKGTDRSYNSGQENLNRWDELARAFKDMGATEMLSNDNMLALRNGIQMIHQLNELPVYKTEFKILYNSFLLLALQLKTQNQLAKDKKEFTSLIENIVNDDRYKARRQPLVKNFSDSSAFPFKVNTGPNLSDEERNRQEEDFKIYLDGLIKKFDSIDPAVYNHLKLLKDSFEKMHEPFRFDAMIEYNKFIYESIKAAVEKIKTLQAKAVPNAMTAKATATPAITSSATSAPTTTVSATAQTATVPITAQTVGTPITHMANLHKNQAKKEPLGDLDIKFKYEGGELHIQFANDTAIALFMEKSKQAIEQLFFSPIEKEGCTKALVKFLGKPEGSTFKIPKMKDGETALLDVGEITLWPHDKNVATVLTKVFGPILSKDPNDDTVVGFNANLLRAKEGASYIVKGALGPDNVSKSKPGSVH